VKEYNVYIMASRSKTLYTGITNDLERRVYEHENKLIPGFTSKYNVKKIVFYESTTNVDEAIKREKQIKGWLRRKKVSLIELMNPNWDDLSNGWYD
jgi:putative endonuclease